MLDLEEVPKQVQQDAPPDPSDERFDRACKQFERACWRINDLSWAAFCSSDPAAARKALHKIRYSAVEAQRALARAGL